MVTRSRGLIVAHYFVFALAAALLAAGCFRQDRRTIVIHVPQMTSPACYAIIQDALKNVEGIEKSKPDYTNRTLEVTFNGLRLGIKNIEFVIAGAGFKANDIDPPEEARARLPEGCR
jgi:copper chaperone CopZ